MITQVLVVDAAPGTQCFELWADADLDVTIVTTGADARAEAEGRTPDVIVLDPALPDVDGVNLCRWLHTWPGSPIIAMPGVADEEVQLALFAAGADDVVVKPVSPGLLRARIDVQLRHQSMPRSPGGALIVVGALRLDAASLEAEVSGRPLSLTPRLFNLLRVLAHNANDVVSPRIMARTLGQVGDRDHGNAIRIAISRLRRQLGTGPGVPQIRNERRTGYRLVPP